MTDLRNLLRIVLASEVLVIAALATPRLLAPQPPNPDLSGLDSLTAADITDARQRAEHGGSPEWKTLAQAFLGYGYYREAEQCYRIAVRLAADDQEAVYGLGFCLERVGKLGEAIAVLQQAGDMSDDELSATCQYQIGRCHLRREEVAEAEDAFRRVPELPAAMYQLAKILIRTNRATEAVPLLEEQLARTPESHKLLQLRALAAQAVGDEATSIRCSDEVLRTEAGITLEYGMTFVTLYRSRFGLDRQIVSCSQSAGAANRTIPADCLNGVLDVVRREHLPQYDAVFLAAAEATLAGQNSERTVSLLDELRQVQYESPAALELRGDALFLRGDRESAVRIWERVAAMQFSVTAHQKLAAWYEQEHMGQLATQHGAAVHQLAGMAAYRQNRMGAAHQDFLQAVAQAPNDARNWFYLGETHRLRGDQEQARIAYTRCLQIDEDYERARIALARLKTPD